MDRGLRNRGCSLQWLHRLRKNSMQIGFVTGHDFSRADKANIMNRALAPAGSFWGLIRKDSEFFRSPFTGKAR